uniref:Phlebovirus glycoprotein G2 fusion domain-containing protein n=1 Tax=Meloidogyne enterolobii TaxID=390850 RepID=A0A6V7YD84_MELEN|nr:unnamed protein product [Meloidogyne enterolobii]
MLMGELEFSMPGLSIQCNQKTIKHLRSYEIKIGSVKRCPADGSCKAGRCIHIRRKEKVPELNEWSNNPGNAYCIEGQSLWSYQCGLPGSACYFYQVYAIKKSDKIFELVSCPTWDYLIDLDVGLILNGNLTKNKFSLFPGMTFHWKNIKFTLVDLIAPMAPILNNKFLVSDDGVALTENFETALECGINADNFSSCVLNSNACGECWLNHEEERIDCACNDLSLEEIVKDPKRALPLDIKRIKLRNNGRKIFSESSYLPVQLMLRMENWSIAANMDISMCHITPIKLMGCYNCLGAAFKFTCKSDFGNPLAEIKCESGNVFTGKCSAKGINQTVALSFNKALINENCNVECPAGITNFTLTGTLEFILPEKNKLIIKNGDVKILEKDSIFDISNIQLIDMNGILWELLNLKIIGICLIVLFLIFIAIKLFLKYSPFFKAYRLIVTILLIISLAGGPHYTMAERKEHRLLAKRYDRLLSRIESRREIMIQIDSQILFIINEKMRRSSFSNNFKQKYSPKMSIISLAKFASELFDCREELAIWRLHSSPFDRKRLERALIEVENNGGWIKAWGNGPLEISNWLFVTIQKNWAIVCDKPEEAVVPSGMKKSWWSGSCTQTFEELKDYLTEDEDGDTIVGPGILREDNVRETSEFFPYSSIFIEENKAEEEDNYYPRVVEELPWFEVQAEAPGEESGTVKGIVADLEIPEGIIEELKFEYFKGKKANARAVVRPEKHFDVHGREVANIEVKFNLRFKMTGIGMLMFLLIIGVAKAIPEKDGPLDESEIWDKYIDNDNEERESAKAGSVLLSRTNNVNQGLVSATLSDEQMRSQIEAIVQDLIKKPSTSSNPLFNSVTSNNSNLLTTNKTYTNNYLIIKSSKINPHHSQYIKVTLMLHNFQFQWTTTS